MKTKQHLYNAFSELYCVLYIVIWFGLNVITWKFLTHKPQMDFGQGIILFIMSFAPYIVFQDIERRIYEYGIYRIRFFLGLSPMLWFLTLGFYFFGITLALLFWEINKDFFEDRIYSFAFAMSLPFSTTLALLQWYFRTKPRIWQLSANFFKNPGMKKSEEK